MSNSTGQFGKKCKEEHFLLDKNGVFFNHGSYGAVPRSVLQHQVRIRDRIEEHPDDWYRLIHPRGYMRNLKLICRFLGAKPENTVLVENVTTGLQSVLNSVRLQPGDQIVVTNWAYNAVKVLANSFKHTAEVIHLEQKVPIKKADEVIERFEQCLRAHPNVKVALIDHITSPTSIVLPVKELCRICREHDVISVIDGAHAPGQLRLNIESIGADFYAGNLYKWMYTPRGCAILWSNPARRESLLPAVVSNFHDQSWSRLHYAFCFRGTMDNTPYHSIQYALEFADDMGGWESIREYNENLCRDAVNHLAKVWGTKRLDIPPEMEAPFMKLVKLPNMANYDANSEGAGKLEKTLRSRYHIQVVCRNVNDELFMRLSCNMYNSMGEVQTLGKAVLELASEPREDDHEPLNGLPFMHWDVTALKDFQSYGNAKG